MDSKQEIQISPLPDPDENKFSIHIVVVQNFDYS